MHGSIRVDFTEEVPLRGLHNSPSERDWGALVFYPYVINYHNFNGLKQQTFTMS